MISTPHVLPSGQHPKKLLSHLSRYQKIFTEKKFQIQSIPFSSVVHFTELCHTYFLLLLFHLLFLLFFLADTLIFAVWRAVEWIHLLVNTRGEGRCVIFSGEIEPVNRAALIASLSLDNGEVTTCVLCFSCSPHLLFLQVSWSESCLPASWPAPQALLPQPGAANHQRAPLQAGHLQCLLHLQLNNSGEQCYKYLPERHQFFWTLN